VRALLSLSGAAVPDVPEETWLSTETEIKYAGYLEREREAARRLAELAEFRLPLDLPYSELHSLSTESRQKLASIRPDSLAQAARVPGVSPSDLQNLVLEVTRRRRAVA
jgi:tRNA uridine 5-carboxymethylaminomethyl modification enzyme